MRVGMLLDLYKPYVSGVTNYVALNKRMLEAMGHRVFVFTFGGQDYADDEPRVVRSPGLPLTVKDTGLQLNLRYSGAAQRKLRSMDVVHVQHPFLSGQLALRYSRASGVPILFTNHTRYDLYAQHYLPAFLPEVVSQTFLQAYLPGFCQQCDLVIAPSAGVAAVLREWGVRAEIKVIPNGIDLAPFQAQAAGRTRAEAGLPKDEVVLMYLGRLGPEKNLAFLLRAFAGVAAACPGVVLALVGHGPEADNLRDQARNAGVAERVVFLGQVPYAEVPAYLRLADLFVTASQTEVHPLSLIEALAAGLPALGIHSPGVGDTIVDGENGWLSEPDLATFTARLVRLVMQPELRRAMSAKARESAQRYDIRRTAGLLLAEYERLAAQKPRRAETTRSQAQRLRQWLS
jgi:glycosyltransferase involved in cell wall biosynthesis